MLAPFVNADLIAPDASTSYSLLYLVLFLIINFLINLVIVYALLFSFKKFEQRNKIGKVSRIIYITIIGIVIDILALAIAGQVSNYYLKISIIGMTVFVVAGMASYALLFRQTLEQKQAVISSIIFGIISNPVWIYLLNFNNTY